jgi:hypothetical protein
MKKMFDFSFYLLYTLLIGCASQQSTTSSASSNKYSEDLAFLRPKFEDTSTASNTSGNPDNNNSRPTTSAPASYTVNKKLDTILDSIDHANLSKKSVEGYTIQVYSGQKREDALNTKRHLDAVIPQLHAELQYLQPNFRVKAGRYFNRLDAQEDFVTIRKYFPNAIITPDRISIN